MRTSFVVVFLLFPLTGFCQTNTKALLLEQFKTMHNKADWFVPVNTAIDGLTPVPAAPFSGNNDETFAPATQAEWEQAARLLEPGEGR